jgi:hypothetical protein
LGSSDPQALRGSAVLVIPTKSRPPQWAAFPIPETNDSESKKAPSQELGRKEREPSGDEHRDEQIDKDPRSAKPSKKVSNVDEQGDRANVRQNTPPTGLRNNANPADPLKRGAQCFRIPSSAYRSMPPTKSTIALSARPIVVFISSRRTQSGIERRLGELDEEWDIERVLEANAASVALAGTVLAATVHKRWLMLPALVGGFLLQHATHGWCPPVPVLRRLGYRTAREIETERIALKALRGDFGKIGPANSVRDSAASHALQATEPSTPPMRRSARPRRRPPGYAGRGLIAFLMRKVAYI